MAGQQQGGGRTYSEEDVMVLMNEAAKRGANEAIKYRVQNNNNEEEHDESVINPKIVKQLKDTVAVFTALKELSSNPLQQTIEETVGTMAASVIQNAFAPRGPPPKRDLIDTILNSQFAFGLGSGIGQRGPELIESMGRTFGSDKAGQMIDGMLNRYGGPPSRQLGPSGPPGPSGPSPSTGNPNPQQQQQSSPQDQKQSEKDLLLSLDPNNPEHVSAYAETQGGLPIEVARKMLMIHQDAFIEQMKKEGQNVDQISTVRGSRSEPPKQAPKKPEHMSPIPEPITEPIYTNPVDIGPVHVPEQVDPTSIPDSASIQDLNQNDMQYAEYQDLKEQDKTQEIVQENQKMMKEFATDIGKIIGDALNKIENLNNTVFALQTELNDVKKQRLEQEQQRLEQQISSTISPTTGFKPFSPTIQPESQMSLYDLNANLQNTDDFINELNNPIDINKDINNKGIDNITDVIKEDNKKIEENQIITEQTKQIKHTEQTEKTKEQTEQTDLTPDNNNIPDNIPDNNILNTEKEKDKFAHPITKNNIKKIAPSFKKDKDIENDINDNKEEIKKLNNEQMNDNNTDEQNVDEK